MLMTRERRPAIRTVEGWARNILLEAGAIQEGEEHGWMKDHADPHAHERARTLAREEPAFGLSAEEAVAAIDEMLPSIGDTCPERLPDR
ncbi:hypothetical protein ACNJX9_09870 [Bradyrhizobium sp. DASA03076]|uniref:hypothetical protein n=1 Tax=Bradyrhizobium sp. BLXBL-03 TaxID=3395916 RepID=UPI003F7151FA